MYHCIVSLSLDLLCINQGLAKSESLMGVSLAFPGNSQYLLCEWIIPGTTMPCILYLAINYQIQYDISHWSQIIVRLSEFRISCKCLWKVWLIAKRPQKDPSRYLIHFNCIHIGILKNLKLMVNSWKNSQAKSPT